MGDCIFCRIVAGTIPATIVHRDARAIAFHDLAPQAPTHVLIIPTHHYAGVATAAPDDAEDLGNLIVVATGVARDLGLADNGYRLVINQGRDGGQTVGHLHLHLLGGRLLGWPPG